MGCMGGMACTWRVGDMGCTGAWVQCVHVMPVFSLHLTCVYCVYYEARGGRMGGAQGCWERRVHGVHGLHAHNCARIPVLQ